MAWDAWFILRGLLCLSILICDMFYPLPVLALQCMEPGTYGCATSSKYNLEVYKHLKSDTAIAFIEYESSGLPNTR